MHDVGHVNNVIVAHAHSIQFSEFLQEQRKNWWRLLVTCENNAFDGSERGNSGGFSANQYQSWRHGYYLAMLDVRKKGNLNVTILNCHKNDYLIWTI